MVPRQNGNISKTSINSRKFQKSGLFIPNLGFFNNQNENFKIAKFKFTSVGLKVDKNEQFLIQCNYFCGVKHMRISYNKLWKLLIDKGMKKKDLKEKASLSSASIAKLGKNEPVAMDVLLRICTVLDCDISDVMEFIKE